MREDAVEHSARPDHVETGLGQPHDGGAVGHVGQWHVVRRPNPLQRVAECPQLSAARRRLRLLGPGEVGHDSLQPDGLEPVQLRQPFFDCVRQEAQPAHAGVQLEVTGNLGAVLHAEGIEMPQEIETRYDRVEGMPDQGGGVSGVKAAQNEDRGIDAGLPKPHAFRHRGDAQAADPFGAQGARGLDVAVAVGVGLHHREDLHAGAREPAHRAQVGAQGRQVDDTAGTRGVVDGGHPCICQETLAPGAIRCSGARMTSWSSVDAARIMPWLSMPLSRAGFRLATTTS